MDSWDKFKETNLPSIEKFYSNLNMSGVSDEDYEHACRVWREFGIKSMGEYHNLYLRTDVILLANVFKSFRRVCLESYGLDPSHFYTAPGLAWKACLKKTGIRLELLLDPDMLLMFERGIRGGITQSVHRWAAASNCYTGSEYDKSKPTKYLQYLDANNLYGWRSRSVIGIARSIESGFNVRQDIRVKIFSFYAVNQGIRVHVAQLQSITIFWNHVIMVKLIHYCLA